MAWFFGLFAVLGAFLGAILASRAVDFGMLTFGIGLIVFAIVLIFWLIKDHFDQEERTRADASR